MNVGQLIELLESNRESTLRFLLPSGEFVPDHFHITEVGRIDKTFVDCGGTRRQTSSCMLQVWTSHDVEHRLTAGKLVGILKLALPLLKSSDLAVAVEYGDSVAAQYSMRDALTAPNNLLFSLIGKQTDCLAPDKCGVGECGPSGKT